MSQSILIFDFGTNEEGAQQARHKIEGWKQGFRLGDKMMVKFEREETGAAESGSISEEGGADESAEKKTSRNQKAKRELRVTLAKERYVERDRKVTQTARRKKAAAPEKTT